MAMTNTSALLTVALLSVAGGVAATEVISDRATPQLEGALGAAEPVDPGGGLDLLCADDPATCAALTASTPAPTRPSAGDDVLGVAREKLVGEAAGTLGGWVSNGIGGSLGRAIGGGVDQAFAVLGGGGNLGSALGNIVFRMAEQYALDKLDESPFGRQIAFAYRAYQQFQSMTAYIQTCQTSWVRCVADLPVQVASVKGLVRNYDYAFPAPPPETEYGFYDGVAFSEYSLDNLSPEMRELLGIDTYGQLSDRADYYSLLADAGGSDLVAYELDHPVNAAMKRYPGRLEHGGALILIKGTSVVVHVENGAAGGKKLAQWLMFSGRADLIEGLDFRYSTVNREFINAFNRTAQEVQRANDVVSFMALVQGVVDVAGPIAAALAARPGSIRGTALEEVRVSASRLVAATGACFAPGTLVATSGGERPIETVQPGDLVVARDPETDEVGLHRVARVFVHPDREVFEVGVRGDDGVEVLRVTPDHPFFVPTRGWTSASELVPGEPLVSVDGRRLAVASLLATGELTTVYNLEVEDAHTYFVGHHVVWVHNECRISERFAASYPLGGRVTEADLREFKLENPTNHITTNEIVRNGEVVHAFLENSRFDNTNGTPKGLPRSLDKYSRYLVDAALADAPAVRDGTISAYSFSRYMGHTEYSTIREMLERYQATQMFPELGLLRKGDTVRISSTNPDGKLVRPPCESCQRAMFDAGQIMKGVNIEYRWTDSHGRTQVWTPSKGILDYNATVKNGGVPVYKQQPYQNRI